MLVKGDIYKYRIACRKSWESGFSEKRLSPDEVRFVGSHFEELFIGKNAHAYSPPLGSASCHKLISQVNPSGSRKVVLLALSSPDERVAFDQSGIGAVLAEGQEVFSTQLEWLKFFISKAQERDDIAFVIRVHPREFPNKREERTSENAKRMLKFLINLPPNMVVNWPSQDISYYELLQRVDLVLTIWSSALLEASIFGCPIVIPANPVVAYGSVADKVCVTSDAYWHEILKSLEVEWTLERAIRSFRWYWLIQYGGTAKLFSDNKRKFGAGEKFEAIAIKVKEHAQKLARYFRLGFVFKAKQRVPAFYGGGEKISHRSINVLGEKLIIESLIEGFDPAENFYKVQHLQGQNSEFKPSLDSELVEKQAVIAEIRYLIDHIPQAAKPASSRIDNLIKSAEKLL